MSFEVGEMYGGGLGYPLHYYDDELVGHEQRNLSGSGLFDAIPIVGPLLSSFGLGRKRKTRKCPVRRVRRTRSCSVRRTRKSMKSRSCSVRRTRKSRKSMKSRKSRKSTKSHSRKCMSKKQWCSLVSGGAKKSKPSVKKAYVKCGRTSVADKKRLTPKYMGELLTALCSGKKVNNCDLKRTYSKLEHPIRGPSTEKKIHDLLNNMFCNEPVDEYEAPRKTVKKVVRKVGKKKQ